ncbi:hypothetical protein EC991_010202 [Linnemannia zychae]|nr:hypothetical protein EC991_010202 [Linnemannia zychae]
MCAGFASGPSRSMMFTGGDCNQAGWTHEFTFWYNQCPWFKEECDGKVYSKNMQVHVYEAFEPHRMMLAPGYDGTKHGWTYKWSIAYMSHFFALSSKGYKLIEERHKPHLVKRADITRPNRSEKDALQALIDCWTRNILGREGIKSYYHVDNCRALKNLAGNNGYLRSARIDNQNAHTVRNRGGRIYGRRS